MRLSRLRYPGQPAAAFCSELSLGQDTSRREPNTWVDDFDHDLMFRSFDFTQYQMFEAVDGVFRSVHWRHADHRMVDIAPNARDAMYATTAGGSVMRLDSTFRFANDLFTVDADFAAGHQDYSDMRAWGELIITTAPVPAGYQSGGRGLVSTLVNMMQSSRIMHQHFNV